jgi:hypothetical protein
MELQTLWHLQAAFLYRNQENFRKYSTENACLVLSVNLVKFMIIEISRNSRDMDEMKRNNIEMKKPGSYVLLNNKRRIRMRYDRTNKIQGHMH